MEKENPKPFSQKPQMNATSATTRYIKFWIYTICISNYSSVLFCCIVVNCPWNSKTFPTAVGKTCCRSLHVNYDLWGSWSRVLSTCAVHTPPHNSFKNYRKFIFSDLHVKSSILLSFQKITEVWLRILTFHSVFLLWPLHYQRLHKGRAIFIYFN